MYIDAISFGLTALATCVIAFYSKLSFDLSYQLKKANEMKTVSEKSSILDLIYL